MGWKSHGFRFKSGRKLRKKVREKGIKIRRALQTFEIGQIVHIDIDPAVHKGMPHPRFQGRTGRVVGVRGRAYLVEVTDGGKKKIVFARPEHLKPQGGSNAV
ncbi:Ribosomal protein L21e [Ferroglobus placidus DSM 10642]|uniref:Large ribosomal subunit protein eL21 n=1 Tax=Ferroglobus placidus (strain DSM 10642 / AEDII12DO) TaxID=589924 RepID=D3S200_FERPA|nr:50S ribosomal protein L21e [Ferroglobus placidus]ADC64457.1 Ribosomal protein L21e [Ferroglobus placidus DSM 10642]